MRVRDTRRMRAPLAGVFVVVLMIGLPNSCDGFYRGPRRPEVTSVTGKTQAMRLPRV
jgi:hypothetical protein